MTSQEWRRDEAHVSAAKGLLKDEVLSHMLEIVRSESPSRFPLPRIGSSADDKALALGQEYGFQACLELLESLGESVPEEIDLQPTFDESVIKGE